MSPAARLVWTYFTGSPLVRTLTLGGIVLYVTGCIVFVIVPPWTLGSGMRRDLSLLTQGLLQTAPFLAIVALFFASCLMPLVVHRLAASRQICVLPGGRRSVLLSAMLTAGLIAILASILSVLFFYEYPIEIDLARIFGRSLLTAFVTFGIMYVAVWLVGTLRGIWLLGAALLMTVAISLPARYFGPGPTPFPWPMLLGLIGWTAFAACFLLGPRFGALRAGVRERLAAAADALAPDNARLQGRRLADLLGTGRPHLFALGQVVPIAAAAWLVTRADVYLFALVTISAIAGAITTYAAPRSRRLWLRVPGSRVELFRTVERAYWRHNGLALAVQLALLVMVGMLLSFPGATLGLAVPLIVLSTTTSTYLGLAMTRGLGWLEVMLGVGTMIALGLTALAITRGDTPASDVLLLEGALAGMTLAYRTLARARWSRIDWMVCSRDDPDVRR